MTCQFILLFLHKILLNLNMMLFYNTAEGYYEYMLFSISECNIQIGSFLTFQ